MNLPFKAPLSGKPWTFQGRDRNGLAQFTIKPRELTPLRAKIADKLQEGLRLILVLTGVADLINRGTIDQGFFEHAVIPLGIAYVVLSWAIRLWLGRGATIVMTVEAISVKRWFGWQRFDRYVAHSFVLWPHDKRHEEHQRLSFEVQQEAQKGKLLKPKFYYGESFHVVLAHGGHRRDLLTVYGEKPAIAILARLQFCDLLLDEAMNIGRGAGQTPQDEWSITPGGFHE